MVWLGIRVISPETFAGLNYDLGEKREKTKIESFTQLASSGDVLSLYFADRAPFRSTLVSFYQKTNTRLEASYDKKLKPAILAKLYGTSVSEITSDDSAFNELFGDNGVDGGTVISVPGTGSGSTGAGSTGTDNSSGNTEPDGGNDENVHIHEWIYAGGQEVSYDSWGYNIYFCNSCHMVEYRDWKNKLIDDSYLAPVVINGTTIMGRSGWLFLYNYGNINYYKANNIMSTEEMDAYMQTLIELDELCREHGIKLAVSIAPDKDQVYSEYMPTYSVADEYKRTERLVDYIKDNSDIAISYTLNELKYSDRFWRTYFKYDTHWNHMGAYIGTMALYSTLGMEVTDPNSILVSAYDYGTAGDLIELAGIDASDYEPDIDYMIWYKDGVELTYETPGYEALENIYRTTANVDNDEKLVLIGDSFRVNMMAYLKMDFAECAFYNREVISAADDDILDCDVLVLQANERNDNRIITSAEYIIELLKKQ